MVGQSKVRVCLNALAPEPSNDITYLSDLTPSSCFRALAVSLSINPNKIPFLFPIIEYEGHYHPLYFSNKPSNEIEECDAYDSYCKQSEVSSELSNTKSFVFQCKDCEYNVHLLCGPLPPSVRCHDCHIHSLTLWDSFVEDDSGDYYCDACEETRDPRICVYVCEGCKYFAHVYCLISEISRVLNGDYGDVKLIVVSEGTLTTSQLRDQPSETAKIIQTQQYRLGKTFLTFKDMLLNLKEGEKKLLAQHFEADNNTSVLCSNFTKLQLESPTLFYRDIFNGDDDGGYECRDVDRIDFGRIVTRVKKFFEQRRLHLSSKNLDVKIVDIKGYMVPWTLASILDMLFQHDFREPSSYDFQQLSPEMKSLAFTFLCHLINSMKKSRVRDIDEERLREWYHYALFLKRLGFRIGFVFERLKRVTLAYFGLQVTRFESETPKTLTREIQLGKLEIKSLEQKIEQLKVKIAQQEVELERYKSSPKSNFAIKCLKEASDLEWKIAGEELFD